MRLGGAFPFNAAGAFPISLGGGGYAYIPPGEYLMTLGSQSVLQWWDPIQAGWRNYLCPPSGAFAIGVDGYNYRLINMSGVVQSALITNAGSGATANGIGPVATGVSVAFAAPPSGQVAKGYAIIGGSLPALNIQNAGGGFVVPPLILIDPPPYGGIQATATATITAAGALSAVTLNNVGAGYVSLPNVYVVPQFLDYAGAPTFPGNPAQAQNFAPGLYQLQPPGMWTYGITPSFPVTGGALVNFGAATGVSGSGTLTGIGITDFGSGYTSTGGVPAITFAGGSLAGGVAATAIMAWAATAVSTFTGGTMANGGFAESGLNQVALYVNNDMLLGRPIRGAVTAGGVVTITDPGFAIQALVPGVGFVPFPGAAGVLPTGGGAATMGGVIDTSIIQGMIND